MGKRLRPLSAQLAAGQRAKASSRIGDAADRIDRLERRADGQQQPAAGEDLRLQRGDDRGVDLLRLQHPAVAEAAVIGIPDQKWGERPAALVVPKRDSLESFAERDFCEEF